jgi:hypothetical protein
MPTQARLRQQRLDDRARLDNRPPRRVGSHGSPPFHPTAEMKRLVTALAGTKMTQVEIALVIVNPHTQRPISTETLRKFFRPELEAGWASLRSLIGRRYIEALNAGQAWAIREGLRQLFGWKNSRDIVTVENRVTIGQDDTVAEFERLLASIRAARTIEGSATEVRQDETGADVVPLSPRRRQ